MSVKISNVPSDQTVAQTFMESSKLEARLNEIYAEKNKLDKEEAAIEAKLVAYRKGIFTDRLEEIKNKIYKIYRIDYIQYMQIISWKYTRYQCCITYNLISIDKIHNACSRRINDIFLDAESLDPQYYGSSFIGNLITHNMKDIEEVPPEKFNTLMEYFKKIQDLGD